MLATWRVREGLTRGGERRREGGALNRSRGLTIDYYLTPFD